MVSQKMKFEEALSRLEVLVEKMERGDLPLDEALGHFEEGIGLSKLCELKLAEAEGRVEKLLASTEKT